MRIIFLRHGKDDDRFRGGWSNLGLLDEGKIQAKKTADYFYNSSDYDIRYILSSDLARAVKTAEYIAAALAQPIHLDSQLRETNNGDLAGMPNTEALIKYPGLFFNTLEMDEAYPNGESPASFYARIKKWFENILEKPPVFDGDLLVVTHGGVINVIYYLAQKLHWTNKQPFFPMDKCSIHVLDTDTMTFTVENQVVWR